MPKDLRPGILYVSEEFGIALHLCPCGCGSKIRTPLSPTDWTFKETDEGPSLYPSVGNWQHACQSHYWITQGEICWAEAWTEEQILAGQQAEDARAHAYYDALDRRRKGMLWKIWYWLQNLFRH